MITVNNIKWLRHQAGLTQQQFSQQVNISQQAIAKWETGKSMPRADKLPVLAKVLGCSVDQLLAEEKPAEAGKII